MTSRLTVLHDVGANGDCIASAVSEPVQATRTVEAAGRVPMPGVIDLHSRAQTPAGLLMPVPYGATTALVEGRCAKWDGVAGAMDVRE